MATKETTFTASQLEEALIALETADKDFPEYPIRQNFDSTGLWDEDVYPLTLTKVGNDTDVYVRCKEYFGGEEGGDHGMYIILSVGWGENERFFKKTGLYNSWDSSEWDGTMYEVVSREVKKVEWMAK